MMMDSEFFTLANGLRVVLHRNSSSPIVCINVAYQVGSRDEAPGRTGFAHLFEHLMFSGSLNVPRGMYDHLCEAAGGYNNAYTNEDKTNYHIVLPAHQMELGLWLESDRLAGLALTNESLETQRQVVTEEKNQREVNQPYGSVELRMNECLFRGHPYEHSVLGSFEDIATARMEDVEDFHHTFYHPANAVLTLAGDFETDQARTMVETYFGTLPSQPRINSSKHELPAFQTSEPLRIHDDVPLPAVFVGFRTPSEVENEFYDLDVLTEILGCGERSRLHHALVYEKQIASQASAYIDPRQEYSPFVIYAVANPGHTAEELHDAINSELGKLFSNGLPSDEVQRAINHVETRFYQTIATNSARADKLSHYALFYDDPALASTLLSRYAQCDEGTVLQAGHAYLSADSAATLYYLPFN